MLCCLGFPFLAEKLSCFIRFPMTPSFVSNGTSCPSAGRNTQTQRGRGPQGFSSRRVWPRSDLLNQLLQIHAVNKPKLWAPSVLCWATWLASSSAYWDSNGASEQGRPIWTQGSDGADRPRHGASRSTLVSPHSESCRTISQNTREKSPTVRRVRDKKLRIWVVRKCERWSLGR